jgi:hypothetical protein
VADTVESLTAVGPKSGILITEAAMSLSERQTSERRTVVQALTPRTAVPAVLTSWKGSVVGQPATSVDRVIWLNHPDGDATLHDVWPLEIARAPRSSTSYEMRMLDTENGEWRTLDVDMGEPLHSLFATNQLLVLDARSRLMAFDIDKIWQAARSTSEPRKKLFGASSTEDTPLIRGLPLTGPTSDNWGYTMDTPHTLELLEASIPDDAEFRQQARDDPGMLLRLLDFQTQHACDHVLSEWPDTLEILARDCPPEFLAVLHVVEFGNPQAPRFGALDTLRSRVEDIVEWRTAHERRIAERLASEKNAVLPARILLHEYVRRCRSQIPIQDVLESWGSDSVAINWDLKGPLRAALSWCNLERLRPPDEKSGNRLRWSPRRIFGFKRSEPGSRLSLEALAKLMAKWPGGCPSLVQDVGEYLEFLSDCVLAELVSLRGRSVLQQAVARAWRSPALGRGVQAFISHSHKQSDLAWRLADGLGKRGVAASLDAIDLRSDASDWEVETWIAEQVLRSEAMVYLVSQEFLESGWVHRETEWEFRLLGVKHAITIPYLVIVDSEVASHPPGRTVDLRGLTKTDNLDGILDELAARITLDSLMPVRSVLEGTLRGFI